MVITSSTEQRNTPQNSSRAMPPWRRILTFLESIKFEHSIFALPFAVAATFMTYNGLPEWAKFGWIVLAMITLRTFAMAANRIVDAEIDRLNPRTANRPTANGIIRKPEIILYMLVSAALFIFAASQLDIWALYLSPIPIIVAFGYPYLKRFTWLAHFGIGAVYVIVPPAVPIAMTGSLPQEFIWMGIGAMFWVSGFDILYAISDIDFDRANKLHSIPARFGIKSALIAAKLCHVAAIAALAIATIIGGPSVISALGLVVVATLLAYENLIVSENDLSKLNMAFFTMNGVIAIVYAAFVIIDQLV